MLHLPAGLHRALIAAARGSPAEEVCGLLAGRNDTVEKRLPVTNALHRADAFDMEPAELIKAMRHLRETGQDLVAIYHSHPTAAPYPSATDLVENQYPEVVHLIIGREERDWRVRAFRLDDGAEEVALRLEE